MVLSSLTSSATTRGGSYIDYMLSKLSFLGSCDLALLRFFLSYGAILLMISVHLWNIIWGPKNICKGAAGATRGQQHLWKVTHAHSPCHPDMGRHLGLTPRSPSVQSPAFAPGKASPPFVESTGAQGTLHEGGVPPSLPSSRSTSQQWGGFQTASSCCTCPIRDVQG